MHLLHQISLLKIVMILVVLPLVYFLIYIYSDTSIYIISLYSGSALWFSTPLQIYIGIATIVEPSLVKILTDLMSRRNKLLEEHRDKIRETFNNWINNLGTFGYIEMGPQGFSAREPEEPRIKFYNEAKEHLKSGYNKKPYNAWDLWEEIKKKWRRESIRVNNLWFAFECIVKNKIDSLSLSMVNWNKRGYPPAYWYDLSQFLYWVYREIKEFDGRRRYNQFPKIVRHHGFLNVRGRDIAKGSLRELRILKRTFVELVNNQQLIKLVNSMKPNAYIEVKENFIKCIRGIIEKLELGQPLKGKCSTFGY